MEGEAAGTWSDTVDKMSANGSSSGQGWWAHTLTLGKLNCKVEVQLEWIKWRCSSRGGVEVG